ncbi:LCP family protein [Streptomyces sp. R35]|uniref:LCP family protein n=1 Tax=Streptomyces sp. R35 TaxID=3238630 RepID=A0AB39S6I9_9ACTN
MAYLSELRDRISVVSLPRHSLAEIPAYRDVFSGHEFPAHPAKLNSAYAEGGAPLTVRTVEDMTHMKIDRYLQVDFRRFMDAVDAFGGVEVCTGRPLKDSATKLDLAPGKHRLGGGEALQYVRSRHVDGSTDLGRMQRQQRFLVSVLHRLKQLNTDPVAMARVAHALLDSTWPEPGFGVGKLREDRPLIRPGELTGVLVTGGLPRALGQTGHNPQPHRPPPC